MTTRERLTSAPPPPTVQRQVAAVLAGALTAALGALVFGEYDLSGITPFIGGLLFGLFVAEVILTVAREGTPATAVAAAVTSGLGVYWAAWISSGRGLAPISARAYAGMVLAAVISGAWVLLPTRQRTSRPGGSEPVDPGAGDPAA